MWNCLKLGINLMTNTNSELDPLRVLIVGCGNIAGGFDQGRDLTCFPYTHAGAYDRDSRFKVTACIEPDDNRRIRFMSDWGLQIGFRRIDEMLNLDYQFEVISICSPTTCHEHDIEVALSLNPKLIFCEKPVTSSLADNERFVEACRKSNVLMAVNHTRRWDPDISELRTSILSGQRGELRSVVGLYNKGILNNGSHMLDLLHLLIGKMDVVKVGKPVNDFFQNDPTIPVWLESEDGVPIHLACAHAADYAIFELKLIFSHGVLTMEEGGLYWRERLVAENNIFKGYRKLDEGVRRVGGYPNAMLKAVDNIYRAITEGETLDSTGDSALLAHRMSDNIKQMVCPI